MSRFTFPRQFYIVEASKNVYKIHELPEQIQDRGSTHRVCCLNGHLTGNKLDTYTSIFVIRDLLRKNPASMKYIPELTKALAALYGPFEDPLLRRRRLEEEEAKTAAEAVRTLAEKLDRALT